jgi:heptaprenyl diphosphate synthase
VLLSLFSALALAVGMIETWFPLPFPGVRLGLSNSFSLLALLSFGPGEAVAVAVARLCLTFLLSGNPFALACSAGGLICSLPVCIILYKKFGEFGRVMSVPAISVASATAFNVGQVAVVVIITSEPAILAYMPVIIAAGAATGYAVGRLAELLNDRLKKLTRATRSF